MSREQLHLKIGPILKDRITEYADRHGLSLNSAAIYLIMDALRSADEEQQK